MDGWMDGGRWYVFLVWLVGSGEGILFELSRCCRKGGANVWIIWFWLMMDGAGGLD